jgi:GNAT superfamily N-acetyltransferase
MVIYIDKNILKIVRTSSDNPDFKELVKLLDAELAERDGADHPFYAQYNKIDKIKFAVVAYENGKPVSCGAIKEYSNDTMEIKRMYTLPESRGRGIAAKVLSDLENWTKELSFKKCILETGKKQPEAIGLYKKNGYKLIPNYGQYVEVENSLCFKKEL